MEPRFASVRLISAGAIACLLAAAALRAESPSPGATPVIPRDTKVLLLQPIDATVDSAVLHPLRQQIIRLRQQYEFISRHFVVLGEGMAAQAAAAQPPLDLQSAAGRSAATLDELARRAEADWVVSIAVQEIKTDPSVRPGFEVHSTLLLRLRDARRHLWLAERPYVGHLAGGGAPGRLFLNSLDAATGEALAGILAGYPPVVPVSRDGSIVDYLAGQSAPISGDPQTPFLGLKATPASEL